MGGNLYNGKTIKRESMESLVDSFIMSNGLYGIPKIICGSFRRGKQLSGDVELVFHVHSISEQRELEIEIARIFGWTNKTTPNMHGMYGECQFDLFIATDETLGPMLLHATGSWLFNKNMREEARKMGFKLNQYGVFRRGSGELVCRGETEEKIFKYLRMDYVPPEERSVTQ